MIELLWRNARVAASLLAFGKAAFVGNVGGTYRLIGPLSFRPRSQNQHGVGPDRIIPLLLTGIFGLAGLEIAETQIAPVSPHYF